MFVTLGLSCMLICLLVAVVSFYLSTITKKDYLPPNAVLLIDAWRQAVGDGCRPAGREKVAM